MEMRRSLLVIVVLFACVSCKKAEDRACFKLNGDEAVQEIPIASQIDSLFLNDDLYYTLVPSNESKVVLKGGENMLSHIEVTSGNGKLSVNNKNKCRFLRSYKHKIYVDIYVDNITYIEYYGAKELKSKERLYSNELRLHVRDGAGVVDLEIENGYTSVVYGSGYGNFFLKGNVFQCYVHCNSNTFGDIRKLQVENELNIMSNSAGDILINAEGTDLHVTIQRDGDVGYVGTPLTKNVTINGKGKLINLN